jgi:hypothetical protein
VGGGKVAKTSDISKYASPSSAGLYVAGAYHV